MTRVVSLLFHDVYRREPCESGFWSPGADRYKLTVEAFGEQLSALARSAGRPLLIDGDRAALLPDTRLPFALTFDDGGRSYYTQIAEQLEVRGWPGHCFVTTDCIGRRGFLDARELRDLDARGHVIGSHSASHPKRFSACSRSEMLRQWSFSRSVLEDLLGHSVTVASLPGGYLSPEAASTAAESGLRVLFTSEPTTKIRTHEGCALIGRFTLRRGCRPGLAASLAGRAPWSRTVAWTSWTAKGLIKPLLGSSYPQVADWILAKS